MNLGYDKPLYVLPFDQTVNFSANRSQCCVRLPFADLGGRRWRLRDLLGEACDDRDGNDLHTRGLYLDVPPWNTAVFLLTSI